MNIKQLHYFYELAQHRHFAKAAKACFITQPTLSASITALEKSLGTELVVRNSQFVALTQAGEVVLHHAERMLQEQDAMRQELSLFRGGLSGALRIGIVPQSSIDIMPLLKGFNDAYPKVGLHLCVMTHATLMEQLDLHRIDIGLGFDELLTEHQRRALDVQLRHPNPMALLGPLPAHCAPTGPLTLADLQELPLILPSTTMQFRRYLDEAAARQQISLRVVLETDSLFHLVNGVSHGLGCAVVSAGIAATAQQLFKLPCHPLSDASAGTIAFITRKHSVTPAMKAFLAKAGA
ncbi:LysR family transcriptional regulator [Aeromonas caviae]|uniref:LysR family transcriptional regulator n=1 Tax=Aeromonas caviae TaxID=648 RepID=UPI0005A603A7|nr:LysR family transcriptional regulator [Aeromonas caviae]MBS4637815.1 LysR family transcriptional regulator [Aeromonas caviae]WQD87347.1 LysR family transcriptional regulator [Aeromonas caviae]SQH59804.1 LysR family transcriptional regulator [Aeromonas caviae]